jgi:large subunit ribosomal protein L20
MPRATNNVASHRRRKKVLKMAKGYRLGHSKLYTTAKDAVDRALSYAYRDRKQKKRNFRKLWITRINAACRANDISYSRFIHLLNENNIDINRKILADMAMDDPKAFSDLVATVKK